MRKYKPLILGLCAIVLVAATVLGTFAYLKDSSEIVNTFTMGNVYLKLDEAVVDETGKPTGDRTEVGNAYHLVPGRTYTKDPTVTVLKGSEECYVRMLVTVNCYDELTAVFGDPFLPQYFVEGWDNTLWLTTGVISKDEATNTATYEFRYFETVKPQKDADLVLDALFDTIVVPGTVTGAQLETITGLTVTVEAHAIQAAGFTSADEAWSVFSR